MSGCVTADGSLAPDGSGTLQMQYRTPPNATEFLERRRFSSDDVTVDSVVIDKATGTATVKIRTRDVTKLSTAAGFRDATVSLDRRGAEQVLTVTLVNRTPMDLKDQEKPGPQITLTVPGRVLEADEGATVTGNTVVWRFALGDYAKRKATTLTVRFATPAPPAPPDAG